MNVVCSGCGAEYKIDSSKIKGSQAWFKCKKCSRDIVVDKEAGLDEFYPEAPDAADDFKTAEFPEKDFAEEEFPAGTPQADTPQEGNQISEDFFTNEPANDTADPLAAATASQPSPSAPPPKRYRFGLTAKVVFLMLIVSLVPGSIYFAISSKSAHDRIISETDRTGIMVSNQLAYQVDEWIDKNVRALRAIADLPSIQTMDRFSQEEALKALQREYPWMYLVFTTDMKGHNLARSDGKSLKDYGDRQYVKDIVDGSELAWQNLIGKTSKKPALVLSVPIIRQGRTLGLVASAMTREAISERVTKFKMGRTGSAFLVDQGGKTVAHQNNAFVLKQRNMSTHPLVKASQEGREGRINFMDANGKAAIGFTSPTALGWTLAVQQDQKEALAPLEKARYSAMVLLGITLAAVLTIALLAGRTIVKPIKELTEAADRISVGDMDVEINTRSKDEIGDLAQAVTRLQDSIKISISRLQRLRK